MSTSDENDALRPRYGSVLDGVERLTAEEMDERRQQNMAYEYLCHLEEAKRWMEACLNEDLPPTTELEEGLRNGVYLAKLGNFFAPKVVSVKRIYDREQTRYKSTQTNLIKTLTFSPSSPLPPQIFYPETTDIYDRKNMPRCIYCIHALSLYLFKLGLAPQITDLYGKVAFTEEEINNMKSELEKYNIQMPAFSKIGGILANELSVDEAALHAAVIAINEAIDHGDPQGTLAAMRNPNAMLLHLDESSAQNYQDTLFQAKAEKVANSRKRNADAERDVYEELLTQAEIQGNVNKVNVLQAVDRINAAIRKGVAEDTVNELMNPEAQLPPVYPSAADLYQRELFSLQQQSPEGSLTHPELLVAVEMLSSVVLINEALDVGDRAAVWKQLSSSVTGLSNVEDEYAQRYMDELMHLKAAAREEGSAYLTWNDIQACVDQVNGAVQEEHERIAAIGLINEALDEGDPKKTLEALQHPAAKLTDVDPSISQHYFNKLLEARREKAHASPSQNHYYYYYYYYYSEERSERVQWVMLSLGGYSRWRSLPSALHCDSVVSGVTAAYNREQLWLANESLIAKLQARCRGFLVRRSLKERLRFLETQDPAIKCIQAHWRGYKEKKAFNERKQFLKDHTEDAVKIQSMVRMHQARKKYRDRLKYFKDRIDDVVKIQAFIRANKARDDYKTLNDPPMAVVRKFVHLLDHSDQDFQEELELMRLREEVITNIRSNQQLENDLNLMDIKIGLLVKNKITLQEVVSHSKKLTKKNKGELSNLMMMNKQKGGLKALSKEKREKLEAYQYLFYLLQTNPTYLAKLIFQMPQNKSTKFMDSVIFTLYNYASNQREEYLLLKLFKTALQEEIKSKVDQIQEIVTGNPTVIKMVVSFNRGARGQNALRQILSPVVKEIMDDKTLNIKTDPVDIYKSWVNQMESQTGEASKLPYDVTPEQAMSHEEVRNRLEASIKNMRTVTDKFLSAIVVSVDKIPYGMRFIAKVLKDTLHEKFPDATEDELLKIVGNLLYYRYMNPAIVAPDAFDIIDMSAGGQLTTDQRRNLGSIAKMLQHAASNKMFLGDNAHLNPINEYLTNSYQKFRRFFLAACDVPTLEEKFNVDQYSDLVTVSKPVIYISIGEIINTHTLLLDHQDAIAPEHNDPIHELLEDLGEVPTIESLIGENPLPPDDPNKEMMGKTEVSLTLTNKFDVPGEANAEMDAKTLLLNTKRLIVDVIRFQPGETLSEILETAATPEQEVEYQRAMQRRAIRDAKTPEKMKQTKPVVDDSLTLQGKKDKIKSNLQRLAELGKVHPENRYQDLINDIAKDIRNQRRYRQRRKAELVKLQQTNSALNTKTSFYNVQIDYYNQYIKTCMDNLASKGKVSKKPGDNKAKKSKQASQKYTAARLHEKGVLIEIEDLQTNQFKNVHFEISPSEVVGVFEIKAKFMGVHLETLMLEYQDLLQLQYEGVAVMKLFDRATVNVNLLIFLLNKKFYGK
uniref:IQ motif containing GTPase activating protein 1 n=1 Tax=Astyanax mexicanus TaxID=7994 RepID=W5KJW7_ASTMX